MPFSGWNDIHPGWRRRAQEFCQDTGLRPTSGYRSPERQAQLYADYLAGRGNPANPPGQSWHEYGLAIDADGSTPAIRARAGNYHIHFPISGEPWHLQPTEARGARYTGDPFPPQRRRKDDDDMATYTDHSDGDPFNIPVVPPGGGASGGGYEDPVYVSLSVVKPVVVRVKVLKDDRNLAEDKEWALVEGRTLVAVCRPGTNSVTVEPKSKVRVDYLVEWGRIEP